MNITNVGNPVYKCLMLIVSFFLACLCPYGHADERIKELVQKVDNEGVEKFEKCAVLGNVSCMKKVGLYYLYNLKDEYGNIYKERNVSIAKKWFILSYNDPVSKFGLGKIFINEKGVVNLILGRSILLDSCNMNVMDSCLLLYSQYIGDKKNSHCNNKSCDDILRVVKKIIDLNDKDVTLTEYEKETLSAKYNIVLADIFIKRNDRKAVKILEQAVNSDVAFSTTRLANIYAKGELVPKDLVRAYMLYDLSGTGYADEKAKVAEEMTPAQIQQAKEMSWRWQDEHRSYRPGYRDSDMGVQWQGVHYH